jgi:hypothetical protein
MSDQEQKQIRVDKLSQRNAASAQAGLAELNDRLSKQYSMIMLMEQNMKAMMTRLIELEAKAQLQQVQLVGAGPTKDLGLPG